MMVFEFTSAEIKEKAEEYGVLDRLVGGIMRYIVDGINPGSFLRAVFRNDLEQAFAYADEGCAANMKCLLMFLHNATPQGCHGKPERHEAWIKHQGMKGYDDRKTPEEN